MLNYYCKIYIYFKRSLIDVVINVCEQKLPAGRILMSNLWKFLCQIFF
jgi:hypothetical protein